jgi:hypothetical protein
MIFGVTTVVRRRLSKIRANAVKAFCINSLRRERGAAVAGCVKDLDAMVGLIRP